MPSQRNDTTGGSLLPHLKLVADTGFYIASTLKRNYARNYLTGNKTASLTYDFYSSEAILLEVQEKLEGKFGLSRPDAVQIMLDLRELLTIVYPAQKIEAVRDPDDDKILECAVEANADVVISFDKDLLTLKEFEGIKIIHPSSLKYLLPQ